MKGLRKSLKNGKPLRNFLQNYTVWFFLFGTKSQCIQFFLFSAYPVFCKYPLSIVITTFCLFERAPKNYSPNSRTKQHRSYVQKKNIFKSRFTRKSLCSLHMSIDIRNKNYSNSNGSKTAGKIVGCCWKARENCWEVLWRANGYLSVWPEIFLTSIKLELSGEALGNWAFINGSQFKYLITLLVPNKLNQWFLCITCR